MNSVIVSIDQLSSVGAQNKSIFRLILRLHFLDLKKKKRNDLHGVTLFLPQQFVYVVGKAYLGNLNVFIACTDFKHPLVVKKTILNK